MIYWIHWITPNYHKYLIFYELIKKKREKKEEISFAKKINK